MTEENRERTIRVLIVEDDEVNLFVAQRLLRHQFQLETANSSHRALDIAASSTFDVVLMDINLGDESMDGVEVMQRMRTLPTAQKAKFVALTSYAMPEDEEKYLGLGFDLYIAKPIIKDQLIYAINRLCNNLPPDSPAPT